MAAAGGAQPVAIGVAGNGQNELHAASSGESLASRPDESRVSGEMVGHPNAGGRREHGVCSIPEERNGHGAGVSMDLRENEALSAHHRMNLRIAS